MGGKVVQVATFRVRQRLVYYEGFTVEADTPEEAIDNVIAGDEVGEGMDYLEAQATYLLDEDGIMPAQEQPDNAFGY